MIMDDHGQVVMTVMTHLVSILMVSSSPNLCGFLLCKFAGNP